MPIEKSLTIGSRLTISDKIFSTSSSAEVLFDFLRIESEYLARSSADLLALDSHTAFLRKTSEQDKFFESTYELTKLDAARSREVANPESLSNACVTSA